MTYSHSRTFSLLTAVTFVLQSSESDPRINAGNSNAQYELRGDIRLSNIQLRSWNRDATIKMRLWSVSCITRPMKGLNRRLVTACGTMRRADSKGSRPWMDCMYKGTQKITEYAPIAVSILWTMI